MSIDTGRERIDKVRQRRRRVVRLTPGARPRQAGKLPAPSPSQESAGPSEPRERNESSGPKEDAKRGARGMSLLPAGLGRLGYYGMALLFVGVAGLLRWAFAEVLSPTPFLVFYLALVGAAAFGGLGPGLLATLASWLCVDLFFDPSLWHVGFDDPGSVGRLMVLLAAGLAVSVVGETMRRSRIYKRRQGRELADANAALRTTEEKYRIVADNTYDWEFWLDPEDRFLYTSPSCERVTGYAAHEFMNHPGLLQEIIHPEDLPAFLEHQRETPPKHLGDIEFRIITKTGEIRWIHHLCQPVHDKDGRYTGSRGSNRDISERKWAEEAVAESRRRYRGLVERINDWAWEVDADCVYTYASPRARELLGYAPEEIVGKTPFDLMPPAEAQRVWDAFRPTWLERKPLELLENTLVRKDGRLVTVETSGMPMFAEDGTFLGYTGIDRDVTARKWAEEQLRRSEQDLNRAQAVAKMGSWRLDVRRNELRWSQETYRIFGIPTGTPMTYETFLAAVHPAEQEYVNRQWTAALRGELSDIEYRIVVDGQLKWVRARAELEFDEEGTLLGGFGTVQDITERKQAEQDLRESRNKYQALIETTADFIWEMDASGKYTYCSPQMKDLWGYEPKDMIGKTPFDVMPPEDRKQALASFMALAKSPQPFTGLEASSYDSRGRLIAVEISGVPFFDADGRLLGYRGISRDITERKRAEEALRASQESLALAQEIAHLGNWSWDLRTDEQEWSDESFRIFGFEPGECRPNRDLYVGLLHPEDRGRILTCWSDALETNVPFNMDYRIIRRDGSVRHVHSEGQIVRDDEGQPLRVFGINQDITERKRAEEALRASQSMLQSVMENVPQGIFWKDRHSTYLGCNNVFAQAAGLKSPGDIVGKTDYDLPWLPEQTISFREYDRRIMENDTPEYHIIEPLREADGKLAWVETNKVPLHDAQGQVIGILGTYEDITERRQAEQALRESEEKFRLLAETSPAAILIYQDGKYVYANPAAESLTGYRCAELLPQPPGDIVHPDHRQQVKQMVSRRAQGEEPPVHYELKILTKDGQERWMDSAAVSITYGNKPAGLVVAFDVTERKQAEEALRRAKTFTDKLLNAPFDTVFVFEPVTGKPVRWNKRFAEVSGYDDEEIAGMKAPDDFYHEDDLKKAKRCIGRILADGQGVVALSLITKQGVPIPFEYVATVVEAEDGKSLLLSIGRDITERKRAEEALRESEERFRIMADGSPNPIWVTNAEGERIFANKQYLEYFGISKQEMERGEWKLFIHPDDAPTYVNSFMSSLKEHRPFSAEARVRRADSQWRWVESHAEPRLSTEGGFLGFVGITQDITQRKQAEEALRELNATLESKVAQRTEELEHRARQLQKLTLELTEAEERERKRLAGILHDDLQQVLAAAKFQVGLLDSRVKNDADLQEMAGQAKDLLVDAIAKSRSLSHELSAPVLSRSDLGEAFEWLAEQMQTKHGFTVHLDLDERIELASEPLRVLLYKAAQEALFNVIKHAGVREAKLRLRRHRGRIRLSVSDEGRGFDPTESGTNLGFGLLSIRERVGCLGGRLKIRSAIGKGSIFLIAVPEAGGSP